jgi:hypothetical protein
MDDGGFKHDGEGHGSCTGYGCNCDEKRYGSHRGGGNGNGNSGCVFFVGLIIASIVGAFNQILGALIIVIIGLYYIFFR